MRPVHLFLGPLFAALATATAFGQDGAKEQPAKEAPAIRKVDRMRVVGGPILDAKVPEGVYLWIEDGAFQLAAVARNTKRKTFSLRIEASQPLDISDLGPFKRTAAGIAGENANTILLRVNAGATAARGHFVTKGEITVSEVKMEGTGGAMQSSTLYLGPLIKRAADSVRIGRY